MPRHLISDAHEWINEIPSVPVYYPAKPQPRERAWQNQRGKKTTTFNTQDSLRRVVPGGGHCQVGSFAGAAHLRIHQVLDCSPTNRERELGLDRRETVPEWPCCHDPLRFSPLSLRFDPPPFQSHVPPQNVKNKNPKKIQVYKKTSSEVRDFYLVKFTLALIFQIGR
ncbi:hypothetical protein YC2023_108483 [Brassica napus]